MRLRDEVRSWLSRCFKQGSYFVDRGCGPGMLIAAAAAEGHKGIGSDVSLTWLVAAQRLIAAHGARPVLAAAPAESLPLADRSVTAVISIDVLEHLADPAHRRTWVNRRSYGCRALTKSAA